MYSRNLKLLSLLVCSFLLLNSAFAEKSEPETTSKNPAKSGFSIGDNNILFFLCDSGDRLYDLNRTTNATDYKGSTAAGPAIEAIAYNPFDDQLYGCDANDFVKIDKINGAVTLIGDIDDGNPLTGSNGNKYAYDVDGLEFDTWGGFYWAAGRISGDYDFIFKINASTGKVIRDAFGPNIDYITIDGTGVNLDTDDIAINPLNGKMYAASTVSGSSKLIEVNRYTGVVISSVDMDQNDVEGLGFSTDGVLYATIGTSDEIWEVALDGTMSNMIDVSSLTGCGDIEAITATTAPVDTIAGTVYDDADMDMTFGAESGIAGVTVHLYYDVNGDGLIDPDDIIIQTTTTDANGEYGFEFGTNGDLLIDIDVNTLPTSYAMTTGNLEVASFTIFASTEEDFNNNFGATSGADCDGDGIPDFSESSSDSDNDGINDNCDLDSDNDGILDAVEGLTDTDGDGILDLLDLDSDNDGIPDAIEANNGVAPTGFDPTTGKIIGADTDNDGLLNDVDNLPTTTYGASTSLLANPDHDGDGYADALDLDADNDGILDIIEAGGVDADQNGMADNDTDANTDGYADVFATTPLPIDNTDADGLPNYIDIDADNDGLDDTLEGLSTPGYATPEVVLDIDADGIIDFWDIDLGGTPITPEDTDNDGTPDYTDLDSDNDNIVDLIEGNDSNADGIADFNPANADADGDGLDDAYDDDCGGSAVWGCATTAPHQDFDADLAHDWRDTDDDGDSVPTAVETTDNNNNGTPDYLEIGGDIDNDGVVNALDLDNDNDGIPDTEELSSDSDGDGIPDIYDLDSDNDGIPDLVEAGGVDMDGDGKVDGNIDSDGNGIPDYAEPTQPTCTLGDVSAPTDGICDNLQLGVDTDGDGIQDSSDYDQDGDGLPDAYDANAGGVAISNPDSDNDGLKDAIDLDADNDGIPDVVEATGTDVNGDGIADNYVDTDGDGFNDVVDGDVGNDGAENTANATVLTGADTDADGIPNSYPADDTDGDGILDHLDLDSDNDGLPDVVEAGGTDTDGDGVADNYVDGDNDGFNDTVDGDPDNSLPIGTDTPDTNTANALQLTNADSDTDGQPNGYPEGDTDGDGYLDHLDLDADNDGIQDIVEAGGADDNGDGFVDNFDPATGTYDAGTDDDNDGFSNYYDSDVDNNGTTGDAGTDPMITTTADVNLDGTPDNGFVEGDLDGDNIPNHLDLDADNDGILDVVEASVTDANNDGIADDALTNDLDGNGWSNSYDGENGGAATVQTTDSDNNGFPDSYDTENQDSHGLPNFLDIDADNDGIVDNSEGQATHNYIAPDNADADGDGIDDAYDAVVGFGGAGLTPENTDWSDLPDYLDLDTDNDGEADVIEGHDTNADGVVDGSDTPVANTGLAGGLTDIDGDGLLDGFDNNTASTDATNSTLAPNSHNDVDDLGVDQDWRQGACPLCKVEYVIQDGGDVQTTTHKYDAATGLLVTDANVYGVTRTNKYCEINGWRYYYNPAAPTEVLFAMRGDAADLDLLEYIELKVGQDNDLREGGNATAYTKIMNRDWFVKLTAPQSNPIDVRFYYPGTDFGTNGYINADTNADTYGLTGAPSLNWFVTDGWDTYDPTTVSPDASNLVNQTGYTQLTPVTAADNTTGASDTDGTTATVGNAKNYVQFDGLANISGGTAAWGVGGSALPVELLSFTGRPEACTTLLNWVSASEEAFSAYELEWSADGRNFEMIESIAGAGGSDLTKNYNYTHEKASAKNYYRLKMVDLDGSYEYSDLVFVETACANDLGMTVFPNPLHISEGLVTISLFSKHSDNVETQLVITDLTGRVVSKTTILMENELTTVRLDISDLPIGMYHVHQEGTKLVKSFVIQN